MLTQPGKWIGAIDMLNKLKRIRMQACESKRDLQARMP